MANVNDPLEYMKAGYMPQIGCNRLAAVLYVSHQCRCKAQMAEDGSTILIDIGDEESGTMWAPSGYYWDGSEDGSNGDLFTKIGE